MNYAKKIFLSLNALILVSGSLFAMQRVQYKNTNLSIKPVDTCGRAKLHAPCIQKHMNLQKLTGEEKLILERNRISFLERQLDSYENSNKKYYFTIERYDGIGETNAMMNPLEYAATKGNVELMQFFVKRGADINKKPAWGLTLLHIAIDNKRLEAAKFLIEKMSFDVEKEDGHSSQPLHLASRKGDVGIVKMLLQNAARVNARDVYSYMPLNYAAMYGHKEVAEVLIEHGAEIDASAIRGHTALSIALLNKHEAIAAVLRAHTLEEKLLLQRYSL